MTARPSPVAARRASRASALAAVACALAGCVLFVPETTGGPHCGFDGEATDCGECLRRFCSAQIDDACRDANALATVLPKLEGCAARGDEACDEIPDGAPKACLQSRCSQFCFRKVGVSETRCTDSFFSPGLACACKTATADTANDLACNTTTYARTRCCAPPGWPGPGLECTCKAVSCTPFTDGCICILTDNVEPSVDPTCNGVHCCAIDDRCQCRVRACEGGEHEVAACGKATLACAPGTSDVDSCAIRR